MSFSSFSYELHVLILFKCILMFVVMSSFASSRRASGKIGYTN